MATLGQAIVERDAPVIRVVHPLPAKDDPMWRPLAKPRSVWVKHSERSIVGGGPYRSAGWNAQVTIRLNPIEWWVALGVLVIIGVVIRDLTQSVALGWIGGAIIVFVIGLVLALTQPSLRRRIVADRDGVQIFGGRKPLALAAKHVIAIETCEVRSRFNSTTDRISSYGVRAVMEDGQTVDLATFTSLQHCWWLEETLEEALGLERDKSVAVSHASSESPT